MMTEKGDGLEKKTQIGKEKWRKTKLYSNKVKLIMPSLIVI